MIGIVVSRADSASEHIGEQLLSGAEWEELDDTTASDVDGYYRRADAELRLFEGMHLSLERPAAAFEVDLDFLVFVSRHAGDTGPLLTAHFTGNFGPAEYGGDPGALARACPAAQKRVLTALEEHAPERYNIGIECTHHGPTDVGAPSMFVELGSDEPQWRDPDGARAVAAAVLDLAAAVSAGDVGVDNHVKSDISVDNRVEDDLDADSHPNDGAPADRSSPPRQVVGFGGGHYAPRFERIVRETPWAVGHIGADWSIAELGDLGVNRDVIDRAFRRSASRYAVIEGEHPDLTATIEELGYRVVSETWVRAVGSRSLALVDELESALSSVASGLRFGDAPASGDPSAFDVIELPTELLAKVQGVAPEHARSAVERHTLAFETEEGATRAAGRAAVSSPEARRELIEALADALREEYDTVEHTDGAVVLRSEAFDPAKARDLGVPDGPLFGRLAAGEAVEVDGQRIIPEEVRSERVDRFDV